MTFIRDFVFLLLLIITVQKGEAENDCETDTIKVKNHFNMVYEAYTRWLIYKENQFHNINGSLREQNSLFRMESLKEKNELLSKFSFSEINSVPKLIQKILELPRIKSLHHRLCMNVGSKCYNSFTIQWAVASKRIERPTFVNFTEDPELIEKFKNIPIVGCTVNQYNMAAPNEERSFFISVLPDANQYNVFVFKRSDDKLNSKNVQLFALLKIKIHTL